MPETRLERGVFILGVLAIAALGFLVVHLWHNSRQTARASGSTTLVTVPRTSPATRPTASTTPTTRASATTHARTTTPAVTARTTTSPPAGVISLAVTAKVDTWLEIRSASSTGPVLYSGTLAAPSTKTVHARTLWIRFGAAGNVSVRLDGRPIHLPSGTYDATFDKHGVRRPGG